MSRLRKLACAALVAVAVIGASVPAAAEGTGGNCGSYPRECRGGGGYGSGPGGGGGSYGGRQETGPRGGVGWPY